MRYIPFTVGIIFQLIAQKTVLYQQLISWKNAVLNNFIQDEWLKEKKKLSCQRINIPPENVKKKNKIKHENIAT